jgi:PAS domain S-box-containing protein
LRGARLLLRGESTVASTGIAAAAILLSAMAALSWWTERAQRKQLAQWTTEHVRAVGTTLGGSAEAMLAQQELSQLRSLVAEAAHAGGFAQCRVTLPDGRVIADAEPARINLQQLPEKWARDTATQLDITCADGQVTATFPLTVTGRGSARLELSAPLAAMPGMRWEAQAGIGAVGASALVVMLVLYRRLRARMRAIGAIREALVALERGERAPAVLSVNPKLGVEAVPWNALLEELDLLKRQMNVEQAKQAMGSRRSARGDLDAAFDAMPQGLVLVDEHLKVRYANGAAAVFLQVKRDQLAGTEVTQWIAQEEVLANLKGIGDGTLRRKTSIEVEQRMSSGATTVLRFTIRPVRREDSASAMVMIEDITQQRVANESRNHFVAHATHELRTPLTNIRLYVETAIDEGARDASVRGKCLNVINQEARRLERIVGEMLSVAEIEAGSLKIARGDVRLEQLFTELKSDFAQSADEKQIKLTFDLPPKMPVVQADRDKLAVALHNLIGNALKYTPAGGEVTVAVEVAARELVVTVTDNGIGIAEDEQAKVFERFYRATDPRVEKVTGTGLGLTLAREVVRLHGGDITVKSELNKGSTFTLTLPGQAEAA